MRKKFFLTALALGTVALQAGAQTNTYSEGFEELYQGDTYPAGTMITNALHDTGLTLKNSTEAAVVAPDPAFTTASGTNVLQLTTSADPNGAWSSIHNQRLPIPVDLKPGDKVVLSFDMYVQGVPATANGPFVQLRFNNGGSTMDKGNFNELTGATVGDVTRVAWTNDVGFDQTVSTKVHFFLQMEGPGENYPALAPVAQLDNIQFEVIPFDGAPVSGTFVDTDFTQPDYTDGDLAGQSNWLQATGSVANALTVINSAGIGWADTTPTLLDPTEGNAVYVESINPNLEDDAWEGSMNFILNASGPNLGNQLVYSLGITSDANDSHATWKDSMALFVLHSKLGGQVGVAFAVEAAPDDTNRLAELSDVEAGWDRSGSNNDTDLLNLKFKIRKTRDTGIYQGTATLSNTVSGISSATSGTFTNLPYALTEKNTSYNAPVVNFTMGAYKNNRQPAAVPGGYTDQIDILIRDIQVAHSASNAPLPTAAENLATKGSDRTVEVSWDYTLEALTYDVLMAESMGGAQIEIASGLTGFQFVDLPRFNGVTNYYSVRANFDNGTATSAELPGVAVEATGLSTPKFITAITTDLPWGNPMETNGVLTSFSVDGTAFTDLSFASTVTGAEGQFTSWTWTGADPLTVTEALTDNRLDTGTLNIDNNTSRFGGFGRPITSADLVFVFLNGWSADPNIVTSVTAYDAGGGVMVGSPVDLTPFFGSEQTDWGGNEVGTSIMQRENSLGPGGPLNNRVILGFVVPVTAFGGDISNIEKIGLSGTDNNMDVQMVGIAPQDLQIVPSYDWWAGQQGLVSTNNAATDDPDEDGIINRREYAFGGNPTDPEDIGTMPVYMMGTDGGTNGIIVVNVELRDPQPGITYSLETSEDLVNGGFAPDAEIAYLGEENIDYYFKAVTNFVPATSDTEFIDLKIVE